jgi:hypothetical protein
MAVSVPVAHTVTPSRSHCRNGLCGAHVTCASAKCLTKYSLTRVSAKPNIFDEVSSTLRSIQRFAIVTSECAGQVVCGVTCCVARKAICTAREGDAIRYFDWSGRSEMRAQMSSRRELKLVSLGGVRDGCNDMASSRYRRRQSCTEMRSRKSFRKLVRRGMSKTNVLGISAVDSGDRSCTNAREKDKKVFDSDFRCGFIQAITGARTILPLEIRSLK